LQSVAVCCNVVVFCIVSCSVLKCLALSCKVLQCVAVCCLNKCMSSFAELVCTAIYILLEPFSLHDLRIGKLRRINQLFCGVLQSFLMHKSCSRNRSNRIIVSGCAPSTVVSLCTAPWHRSACIMG